MTGVVEGLFGQTPFEIRQHQEAVQQQQAQRYGAQDPMAAVRAAQYGAGQQAGNLINQMTGSVSPEMAQAQQAQQIGSQIDQTTPEGLMKGAQMFNQAGNPQMAQKLVQAAMALRDKQAEVRRDNARAKRDEEYDSMMEKARLNALDIATNKNNTSITTTGMNNDTSITTTGMNNDTSIKTTGMNVAGRSQVAGMNVAGRSQVAGMNNASKERISAADNATDITKAGITKAGIASPLKLTQGQNAADRAFATKEYGPFNTAGGLPYAEAQIKTLNEIASKLEEKGNNFTGGGKGAIPDVVRSLSNPDAVAAQNRVYGIIQNNLRPILGQFTKVEGENLLTRAYNPNLSPAENARSLRALVVQTKAAADAKASASRYFEEHGGTLSGWKGKLPTYNDIANSLGEKQPPAQTGWSIKQKD